MFSIQRKKNDEFSMANANCVYVGFLCLGQRAEKKMNLASVFVITIVFVLLNNA